MKAPKASEFPELRRVFSGYLHEDFLEEHGTAVAALRAFQHDASPAENRRLQAELRRLLSRIDGIELSELRTLLTTLGCRWSPPSRKAVIALLSEVAKTAE